MLFCLLQDESSTMFLIGAYSRYGQPYVWVRSNHERLIKFSSPEENEKDFPLNLKTTSNWESEGVCVCVCVLWVL